jgi:hypothetical protein
MLLRALTLLALSAAPVSAQGFCVDPDQQMALDEKLAGYGDVLNDISCDAPEIAAQQILCLSEDLWPLSVSASRAWVYAYENATGTQADQINPPRHDDFIAARDACTDETCLCEVLTAEINDALGGVSPLAQ